MYAKTTNNTWLPKVVTFCLAGLAASCAAYWALKDWHKSVPTNAPLAVTAPVVATAALLTRALGGTDAVAAAAGPVTPRNNRYALTGIVAARSGDGVALISIDGKTAKPFRVGTPVGDELVLKSVSGRKALLATSAEKSAEVTLELPAPTK